MTAKAAAVQSGKSDLDPAAEWHRKGNPNLTAQPCSPISSLGYFKPNTPTVCLTIKVCLLFQSGNGGGKKCTKQLKATQEYLFIYIKPKKNSNLKKVVSRKTTGPAI